ncbi:T9SS type A sorting domain-containing protein [Hyphobacterium sp. CCMP332]|nr:T9SS type A sorting domain-containing protein [Hyphobacterium sp. CCMP332]
MIKTQKYLLQSALVFAFIFLHCAVSAQSKMQESNFSKLEKEYDQFRNQNDLDNVKAWKWQARWLDFQSKRLNTDGSMSNPDIFLQEAINVNQLKKNSSSQKSSNWSPVGPDFLYPSNFPDRQHGMGRINTIAFHPSDSNIFWVGVAQGGVWKTIDGGQNWNPISDNLPIIRISDIAVDPVNPNVLYVCVGDYAYIGVALDTDDRKRHTHYGMGVYKTTDGGNTWAPTGLTFNQTQLDVSLTRRVLIDPNNTQNLVAGGVNGIYRSTDAGANWIQINDSLIWDLVQDPVNPNVIYAATGYLANRNIGTAGILKSVDFGQSWSTLNTGIPGKNAVQRIKLAIAPSDNNAIYALTCGMSRGYYALYFSDDAGATWNQQSNSSNAPNILHWGSGSGSGGQGTYDLSLLVDAGNKFRIMTGGINIWGSDDAGGSWKGASYWLGFYGPSVHADHHFFAYNPLNQAYYMCHDGGLSKTYQVGFETWTNINNGATWPTVWTDLSDMQITSYYRLGLSIANPGYLVAGSQDNSTTVKTPSSWLNVIGGDGMDCAMDPINPDIVYGSSQYGNFYRSDDGGQNFNYISNTPSNSDEGGWTTPIEVNISNPTNVYLGYGDLWKSTDRGDNWTAISNFPNMSGSNVAPPISDFDLDFPNDNKIYVASRLYFSRSTLSKFWVSSNGGTNWNNRTNGLPDSLFFTSVECASGSSDAVYVTLGGFEDGEKVYLTTNDGINWQNISHNLPNVPINVIVHQESSPLNTIYVGTDVGVYYSNDTLGSWELFSTNLPNVIVSDLEIDYINQKLYAATFGRGIWLSDLASQSPVALEAKTLLNSLEIKAYPNPNSGDFTLNFNKALDSEIEMEIVDVMGRRIEVRKIQKGVSTLPLSLDQKGINGLLYLRFKKGHASEVIKIIVEP